MSDELRDSWDDDNAALTYLESRGIKEVKNGILLIPIGKTLDEMDGAAIRYLVDEWDFEAWVQRT